jgi:hypothetical protein
VTDCLLSIAARLVQVKAAANQHALDMARLAGSASLLEEVEAYVAQLNEGDDGGDAGSQGGAPEDSDGEEEEEEEQEEQEEAKEPGGCEPWGGDHALQCKTFVTSRERMIRFITEDGAKPLSFDCVSFCVFP